MLIEAPPTNVGNVYIGWESADITAGVRHILRPGEALEFSLDDTGADEDLVFMDLRKVFFDGVNSGDTLVSTVLSELSVQY